ncbi:5-oxoprolinase subunit PxpA [Mariniflexile litorale]|uniref:5-oxoprolinase subunit PxpA n=1 Tax=Mariniflexile litorale TaxID=3045158 RepID=A0AAU7EG17_9FLAO|nr:5-oxoprolinase subunit PxpA [Mariniflexile sp. KMM 9835]MDQ8211854.1 5-oxoprolinase subunit PxpA [Mariniflexile sp. KMM 9835]
MKIQRIDINVDVGEGVGNESLLMPYVSSCNIACGGHAGNNKTMRKVVKLAKQYRVKIGAHPSFPDIENFGRKLMDMPCVTLFTSLKEQISDLMAIISEENTMLHHVKPHGALYHMAATDTKIATTIIEVMKSIALPVKLYVPYKSVIEILAIQNNIPITYEAFADRNYNDDLTLVTRNDSNAIIHDSNAMLEHVFHIIDKQKVKTITGADIPIKAETFCVHGDNLHAAELLKNLRSNLEARGVKIL